MAAIAKPARRAIATWQLRTKGEPKISVMSRMANTEKPNPMYSAAPKGKTTCSNMYTNHVLVYIGLSGLSVCMHACIYAYMYVCKDVRM